MKDKSLAVHSKLRGKIEVKSKVQVNNSEELSLYYSPGVAVPSSAIAEDRSLVAEYTGRSNTVAIVSDGTAVLGLGDIGPYGALPVMEGKSMLFAEFAGISAYPLVINSTCDQDVIDFCKMLEPSVGGILLEDIKAPNCVNIEQTLIKELDIPVFHDDQHGTAIVTVAALINLMRLTGKDVKDMTMVLSGTGAAGSSIARMVKNLGVKTIYGYNINGVITEDKYESYDDVVKALIDEKIITCFPNEQAKLSDAISNANIFVGVSAPNLLTAEMVKSMEKDPWIFAMANPSPEIDPQTALDSGAFFVGTGRSDFPNQVNNVLAFPGMFKGVLQSSAKIDEAMKLKVSHALASYIKTEDLNQNYILPSTLDKGVADKIAQVIIDGELNEKN
ncbi:NADP-dependent malic enzyme [Mollicutes bacterium LVI A0039]|nr:NADP-dependent malic enzyme [Mollicutes bacterium LVI A0039]